MTARSVTVNTTWAHISDDRSMRIKQNSSSLEKEAVADITFASTDTYTTGGIVVDLTAIRNLKVVYFAEVVYNEYVLKIDFVPGTGNAASLGKFKAYDSSGVELINGSTALESKKITVVLRGY